MPSVRQIKEGLGLKRTHEIHSRQTLTLPSLDHEDTVILAVRLHGQKAVFLTSDIAKYGVQSGGIISPIRGVGYHIEDISVRDVVCSVATLKLIEDEDDFDWMWR